MPIYTKRTKPNVLSFVSRFLRGFNPTWKDADFMWKEAKFSWSFMLPISFGSRTKPTIPTYTKRIKPI